MEKDEWELAAHKLYLELGRTPTEEEIQRYIESESKRHQDDSYEEDSNE